MAGRPPDSSGLRPIREDTLEALFERLAEAAGDTDLSYYAGMPEPGGS